MKKQSIRAQILLDSIERIGNNRVTTWKLTYPRFIQSEILTHAMLKSNSASSRAIPFKRMVEMVENDPFIPIRWMKEHSGMQGTQYFEDEESIKDLEGSWLQARNNAVNSALELHHGLNSTDYSLTKQICNRLLEPFLWHTIILTGTELENFFALRAHPMAEIHLQDLAYKMLDAYNASTPQELKEGDWHIPFGDELNKYALNDFIDKYNPPYGTEINEDIRLAKLAVKITTAKCAQISYLKFGSDNYEDLIDLHDSLVIRPYDGKRGIRELTDPIHASPAVHCVQAMTEKEYIDDSDTKFINNSIQSGWCHNLRGFKSYRSMLPNENSTDSRVIKK